MFASSIVYHGLPPGLIVIPKGPLYFTLRPSLKVIVPSAFGVIRAMFPVTDCVNHTVPFEATATSKGLAPGVGTWNCVNSPEETS